MYLFSLTNGKISTEEKGVMRIKLGPGVHFMIAFKPINSLERGQIFEMLIDSYRDLVDTFDTKNRDQYLESWQRFDASVFDNPETIGKCVMISWIDDKPVGFISYDPRNFPAYRVVGQNCIQSGYKGKGYGKSQIEELLRIFKQAGCKRAKVSTGDNDFFTPARRMYERFGFEEIGRQFNEKWGYVEIEYEKQLE
jgi:GNAT superfamily N-acetyltransferase